MLAPRVHGHGQQYWTSTRLVFATVTNTRALRVRVAPPSLFDLPLHLRIPCTLSRWAVGTTGPVYPSNESRECILLTVPSPFAYSVSVLVCLLLPLTLTTRVCPLHSLDPFVLLQG
jgi:hypothetical protein